MPTRPASSPRRAAPAVAARRAVLAGVVHLVALAVVVGDYLRVRDRLPDPMATHFSTTAADGYSAAGSFPAVVVPLLLVTGALMVFTVQRTSGRVATGAACAVPALLAFLLVAVVEDNAGAASAARVRMAPWQLAAAVGCAAVAGGLGALLAGRDGAVPAGGRPAGVPDRLDLRAGERAGWARTVGSPVLLGSGVTVAAAGSVLLFTAGRAAGIGCLVAGVVCLAAGALRVTADRRGLTVAPAYLPWPRLRIALSRIEEATSGPVRALSDFGGWGYRVRAGRTGVVLRSGDAVRLRLSGGGEFVVTVDDSATAAALLNALIERERR
ncbi:MULTISPECIES: hypothetical protein [Streptomycetaceae]|uniref:hypothetical protein n=1 Tax=Streptomycetaceae TaxID=2062 RepID=UPI001E3824B0|nr:MULTISPECIES: hypothetical protein [Streptomycetaceae]